MLLLLKMFVVDKLMLFCVLFYLYAIRYVLLISIYNIFLSSHCCVFGFRSRKRRPSSSQDQDESRDEEMKDEDGDDEPKEEEMTECTAALVLMSLSCSPHSPSIQGRYTHNSCLIRVFRRPAYVCVRVESFAISLQPYRG